MLTALLRSLRTGVVTIRYPAEPAAARALSGRARGSRRAAPFDRLPPPSVCPTGAISGRRRRAALSPSTSRAASSAAAAPRARPAAPSSWDGRSSSRRARASRPGGRGRARRPDGRHGRRAAATAAGGRGRRADPPHARPLAAPAPPRRGLVQRLRLGADRAAEPGLRRPAPGHRLRGLAAPRRRRHRHRPGDAQPGDRRPPHLRGGPRAAHRDRRRRLRRLGRHRRPRATRAPAAWPRSCRSTSSFPAARRGPRPSSSASCWRWGE